MVITGRSFAGSKASVSYKFYASLFAEKPARRIGSNICFIEIGFGQTEFWYSQQTFSEFIIVY